jgi:hypothetical protein
MSLRITVFASEHSTVNEILSNSFRTRRLSWLIAFLAMINTPVKDVYLLACSVSSTQAIFIS